MTYRDLAGIFAAKERAFTGIELSARDLSVAQLGYRPVSGGWSIEKILEHLALVEGPLVRLITTLTDKAAAATGPHPPLHSFEVSLESYLERSRTEKYVTRDKFSATGTVKALDSLKVLRDVQAELLSLRPRLESVDPTLVRFPHWIFGPLDLAQWLAFVGVHEERHLEQIHAILASLEFRSITTGPGSGSQ
ncbi:MAG: DinB family protein [Ignavibacteriales bacterium]|nr:DinB family protein [Ignavibacteriales bacterium]